MASLTYFTTIKTNKKRGGSVNMKNSNKIIEICNLQHAHY